MTSGVTVDLNAVAGNTSDLFVVGDEGTILRRVFGEWVSMPSGITSDLLAVAGGAANAAVAVGAEGAVLHFNGTSWDVTRAGTAELRGVWGSPFHGVYVVGAGVAYHFDGTTYSMSSIPVTGLVGIHGTQPSNLFTVTFRGEILQYVP